MRTGAHCKPKKHTSRWVILPVAVLVLGAAVLLFLSRDGGRDGGDETSPQMTAEVAPVEKNQGTISIPGFESFTLIADSKKQTLALPNPAENNCYFRITLLLEDGTELWQSELIEPGESSKPMELNTALSAGTYPNALLRYQCFRMDKDKTPLNGAEARLTLFVR